jgi:hypothetical protein
MNLIPPAVCTLVRRRYGELLKSSIIEDSGICGKDAHVRIFPRNRGASLRYIFQDSKPAMGSLVSNYSIETDMETLHCLTELW